MAENLATFLGYDQFESTGDLTLPNYETRREKEIIFLDDLLPRRSYTGINKPPESHCATDGQRIMIDKPNKSLDQRRSMGDTFRRLKPHTHKKGFHIFDDSISITRSNQRVLSLRNLARFMQSRRKGDIHKSNFSIPQIPTANYCVDVSQ